MKRSPPSISPAQAKSVAAYSKQQAQTEAHDTKLEAMGRDLDRSLDQWKSDLDKQNIELKTGARWLARIVVVPMSILAIGMAFIVLYGLWTGDLPEISRYSKGHVLRAENPVEYWFAFSYYTAFTCAFIYLAVRLLRASGCIVSHLYLGRPRSTSHAPNKGVNTE